MNARSSMEMVRQLIPLLDLTSLNADDSTRTIEALCRQAVTPLRAVAAVCIYPKFVSQAKQLLSKTSVKIATVVNFPDGAETLVDCIAEIKRVISDGVDEVDVVMPYEAYKSGEVEAVLAFLQACRGVMGPAITMKVIIETGALIDPKLIAGATELAIRANTDFVKTSTGKIPVGATLQSAEIILKTIKSSGRPVGLKVAGGVRRVEQAVEYLALAEKVMGKGWASSKTMRFGASSLLQDILNAGEK